MERWKNSSAVVVCGNVAWIRAMRLRNRKSSTPAPTAMDDISSGQVKPCHRARPWLALPAVTVRA